MEILVTGGTGYIGSHTILELVGAGHRVTAVDNFCHSNPESLRRVRAITGCPIPLYDIDLRDRTSLEKLFEGRRFDCCIHFAGFKSVGESVVRPWEYYENNIGSTLILTDVMRQHGCKNLIFSSSATVYGTPEHVPVDENCPKGKCTNPYGKTKSMIEEILIDLHAADVKNHDPKPWNMVILRYFNPIGAHPSGLIGEDPRGVPNNLMPYITQVAAGRRDALHIYGNDYPTPDGTGVRDYVHVVDLARGHLAALNAIASNSGADIYNLGTGRGYSVREVVETFEQVTGIRIPCVIDPRRPGDVAISYADCAKAKRELGWTAELNLEAMCRDSWNWQKKNPKGYEAT